MILPALGSLSKDPSASEDDSAIPTFPPFAAPLYPCLIPSALDKEKAQALSLSRPIYEDIRKDRYQFIIRNDDLGPVSRMWSCQICSCVFHPSYIKRWVRELSPAKLFMRDPLEGWRCPACNLAQDELPRKMPVSAASRQSHGHYLGCPLILEAEFVLGIREGSRVAIVLANSSAMLALAHPTVTRSLSRTCQHSHRMTRLADC
jgi:hypothetical protein